MLPRFLSINTAPTSPGSFYLLAVADRKFPKPQGQEALGKCMIILQIMGAVLVADFLSGLFHWLEDAYGRENWPITGRLVTQPNILHHRDARYFTRHGWFESSWILLCLGLFVLVIAWLFGVLTWQVWLVVILGVNANQVHKWAHRTPKENGPFISLLHCVGLLQTARHHARHHTDPKNSHYCVLTNVVNPVVDAIRLWDGLEWVIWRVFGVRRRIDASVLAYQQKQVSPGQMQNQSESQRLPMLVR